MVDRKSIPLPEVFSSLPVLDIMLPHAPPVERLSRLTEHLLPQQPERPDHSEAGSVSTRTSLYAYRDDLSSTLSPGGNKLRKLAHVLPHALRADPPATHLITEGGVQSNCCRQVAMLAVQLNLKCIAVLSEMARSKAGNDSYRSTGNVQLDKLLGAEVRWLDGSSNAQHSLAEQTQAIVDEVNSVQGQRAFFVPSGASRAPSGGVGYARWVFDMLNQEAQMRSAGLLLGSGRFDAILVACASGSTLAGMIAGMKLAEKEGIADPAARRRILGVDATARPIQGQRELVLSIARDTALLLGLDENAITLDDVEIDGRWSAGAYGLCDDKTQQTLKTVARTQAIFLDPVYTGKAMTAVCEGVKSGELKGNVLFVHTGGQAALPAYIGIEDD